MNGDRAAVTYEDGTVIAGAWNEGSDWKLYGEDGASAGRAFRRRAFHGKSGGIIAMIAGLAIMTGILFY